MSDRPAISVIVPVYNVAPYLSACLDSILAQSFTDWEMLLIDDGSTDQSGSICDTYAASNMRIRVFHQENQGLSAARNTGLANARGAYITMVDSDDLLLSEEYLAILYDAVTKYDAQISVVGLCPFSGDPPSPSLSQTPGDPLSPSMQQDPAVHCFSGLDAYAHSMREPRFNYGHAGGKLYARACFSNVRYPVGKLVEDNAVAHLLFSPCERVAVVPEPLYGYRLRSGGIMKSAKRETLLLDTIAAFHDRMEYFKSLGRPDLSLLAEKELLWNLRIIRKSAE